MRTVKIDENGKILWGQSVSGNEALFQRIKVFLYTMKGEFIYYQYHGIDYNNSLFLVRPDLKLVSDYIEKEIRTLYPGVDTFRLLKFSKDGADGELSYKIIINGEIYEN
jgi:hypothetical protein